MKLSQHIKERRVQDGALFTVKVKQVQDEAPPTNEGKTGSGLSSPDKGR